MSNTTADLIHPLAAQLDAELVETHISWVLLTRTLAYKIKKPVRLPFVDYSTVEQRRHFCEEELRLNQRLAPGLYLGLSRITGTAAQPGVDVDGPVLDYAVRMRRFAAGSLFSELLQAGTLKDDDVDALGELLAHFHDTAPVATANAWKTDGLRQRLLGALDGAAPVLGPHDAAALREWLAAQCDALAPLLMQRHHAGRMRECHGDLHLANIVRFDGGIAAFDCIEFDAALRCIDVLEDAAFAVMDFAARGRADLGWRLLNAWLEHTGDYAGLPALRLYVTGRALVRTLVEHLKQQGSEAAAAYARTALHWREGHRPFLAITHGLPGSGKSYAALRLAMQGGIRIRSDVERKRLFGLAPLESSRGKALDLYSASSTRATYDRLFALAGVVLRAGLPVVLDAAFLRRDERQQAQALARELGVPFSIVDCEAPLEVLRERLRARQRDASEADLEVLEKLRQSAEPLTAQELALRDARKR